MPTHHNSLYLFNTTHTRHAKYDSYKLYMQMQTDKKPSHFINNNQNLCMRVH